MRKEETIIRHLEKLKASRYYRLHHEEIGVLLWVLGKSSTPRAGQIKSRNEAECQDNQTKNKRSKDYVG